MTAEDRAARLARYEEACERFSRASTACPEAQAEARRIVQAAEDEWEAARLYLSMFEKSPGIPLDEYNEFKA